MGFDRTVQQIDCGPFLSFSGSSCGNPDPPSTLLDASRYAATASDVCLVVLIGGYC